MQFYKTRDFGELISATFDFLKKYGKNYFKNFLIINGLFLVLILVVFWIGFGELFQMLFGGNLDGSNFFFEQYFAENQGVLIAATILAVILFLFLSLINYSFPVLYMKRIAETGAQSLTANEMVESLKSVIGKFFIFMFFIILIMIPVMLVVMGLSMLLMVILIGFVLLLFAMPLILNIVNFTLFHFYHTQAGIVSSFSYAVNAQFSRNFWKYWGSVTIVYLVINVVSSVFTILPMVIFYGAAYTDPSGLDAAGNVTFGLIVMLIYLISFLVSFILVNLIYINTGFMYYDSRTDLHREMQFTEIDTLGQHGG